MSGIQHLLGVLRSRPGVDQIIVILHQLNASLTMVSGHPSQNFVSGVIQTLVPLLSSNNSEVVLISLRTLITCIDISPRATSAMVAGGAAGPMCHRLLEIEDMDVAEACLKCLYLISQDNSRPLLEAGAAKACIAFFDFFPSELQQTALATVARLVAPGVCCMCKQDMNYVIEILPFLRDCLKKAPNTALGARGGWQGSGGDVHSTTGGAPGGGNIAQAASLCLERLLSSFCQPQGGGASSACGATVSNMSSTSRARSFMVGTATEARNGMKSGTRTRRTAAGGIWETVPGGSDTGASRVTKVRARLKARGHGGTTRRKEVVESDRDVPGKGAGDV
ncbi:unnamed protein product, partial [Choristocarpus tenellus]